MFKARKPRPATAASVAKTQNDKAQIDERTFSSIEVADVAQVSLRQLQWGDERKVVSPRHEGHRRVYYTAEVIEITVIAELRRKGFSLQKIRRVLRFLQKEMGKRLAEVIAATSNLPLVTDGKSIFLEDQHDRIIDILKNARQPMFLVSVSDQARRLTETERKPARMDSSASTRRAARVG